MNTYIINIKLKSGKIVTMKEEAMCILIAAGRAKSAYPCDLILSINIED